MSLGGILVTDGNERATLAVTRSLGRRGIPVFVGAETPSSLAASSRHCTQSFIYPSPWSEAEAYISCLLDAAAKWGVTIILPMTDIAMELIGESRLKFKRSFILPIPSLDQYHRLSDKYNLTNWASLNGIAIPPTIFVPDGRIDDATKQVDKWPVVIKPARSLLKLDGNWRKSSVIIARDADDLRKHYHEAWFLQQPSMIQQYVAGHGEGVFGLFKDGKPLGLFAHRRLRERPPSGGVSVLRESIPLCEPMTEYAVSILREAKWNGIAMVEFKVDGRSRTPYLMEVNGRFWGSLQLAVDAGVDFPMMLYRYADKSSKSVKQGSYLTGVRSQWWLGDLDHLLARLREPGRKKWLPPGTPPVWKTFLNIINVFDTQTKNEVFRFSDPVPGLFELCEYSLSALRGIGRKLNYRLRNRRRAISYKISDIGLRLGLHRKALGHRFPSDGRKIFVLCKGNICRSPFVDRFLIAAADRRKLNLDVFSAGLDAKSGKAAYPMAKMVSKAFGVDLDSHRTAAVTKAMVDRADIILVMEPDQKLQLVKQFPSAREKTFLLGHFSLDRPVTQIADPYGGTAAEFEKCYVILKAACEGFLLHFR